MSSRPSLALVAAAITAAVSVLAIAGLVVAIATRPAPPTPTPIAIDAAIPDATAPDAFAADAAAPPPPAVYALDDFPRRPELVAEGCPDIPLVDHVGAPAPWRPALRVHPTFEEAVVLLEQAVADTAHEVYGQDEAVLFSASSYRCTTVHGRPERISEHALGNAIDLRGIQLADGTETSVRDHWHAATEADAIHARFWRSLVERVHARGIFRGILGPPDPDHMEHLHFDRGPSTFFDLVLD